MLGTAITLTDAAAARVREILAARGKPSAGVRVGVRNSGCSGLSYTLEFRLALEFLILTAARTVRTDIL